MEEDAGPAVHGEAGKAAWAGTASATRRLLRASLLPQDLAAGTRRGQAGTRWHHTSFCCLIHFLSILSVISSNYCVVISVSNLK